MSYDVKDAARALSEELRETRAVDDPGIALKALYVAQAEAWGDAIQSLESRGYFFAAQHLSDQAEAMWTRRAP